MMKGFTEIEYQRALFESAPIAIVYASDTGAFIQVNESFCCIVGYSEGELLKLKFQDITHPADLEGGIAIVNSIKNREKLTYSMLKRYITKTGHIIWVQLFVYGIFERDVFKHFIAWIIPLPNENIKENNTSFRKKTKLTVKQFIFDNWKFFLTLGFSGISVLFSAIFWLSKQYQLWEAVLKKLQIP
ncbi:MAG: PAS domain S-box protein [Nanoarchaeota archaeon]